MMHANSSENLLFTLFTYGNYYNYSEAHECAWVYILRISVVLG